MAAKWPVSQQPKGATMVNEGSHNFTDPNRGGGPAAPVMRNAKRVPDASKGGPYQSGRKQYVNTSIRGTRGSAGNPANRGNVRPVGRQSFPSEVRNPRGGGGVQLRDNLDTVRDRGGFGKQGQGQGDRSHGGGLGMNTRSEVPNYGMANPRPGAGNVGGRMARRIIGRFNNKSKGARTGGTVGSYGDRAPISSNT